jgi:hypothetical protein
MVDSFISDQVIASSDALGSVGVIEKAMLVLTDG